MKLEFKEDPKEWRKAALLAMLGLSIFSTALRWRRACSQAAWLALLGFCGVVAVAALVRPKWFRGFYRLGTRVGFYVSRTVSYVFLGLLFFLVFTPVGWVLRMAGKDPLRLRRPDGAKSYWLKAPPNSPLDRLY